MEEVYRWVDQYGGNICRQLRRMGSSVDWSRQVHRHTASACSPRDACADTDARMLLVDFVASS